MEFRGCRWLKIRVLLYENGFVVKYIRHQGMRMNSSKLENFDIICPSWIKWDNVPIIMHYMASMLSEKNRILFVNPPISLATYLFHPELSKDITNSIKLWREGPRKVNSRLWVWTPPPLLLQVGFNSIMDRINHQYLKKALLKVVGELKFSDFIIWSWHPFFFSGKPGIGEKLVCFDCNDNVPYFESPVKLSRLEKIEKKFVQNADLMIVTSQALRDKFSRFRPDVHLSPSGVDLEVFSRSHEPDIEIPDEVRDLPRPLIGYIGAVDGERLDWNLIRKVAERKKSWTFSFVGPVTDSADKHVNGIPNIHFHGKKKLDDLPGYLKAFDILIIPFKTSDFSAYSFPTKTFEYFASGKPVVSMPIPALEQFVPLLKIAGDSDSFISATEEFLDEDAGSGMGESRIACAEDHTWEKRLENTTQLVLDKLIEIEPWRVN